ncbi:MAG: hemin uptake protein HemP [Xanthobacteraceae bacterium]|nr:hemin uptake protein HemP [Xanthobacteraceae bacterium]
MTAVSNEEKANEPTQPQRSSGPARSIALSDNCLDSRDLFATTREIAISHAGETYRLRLTAQNKLILTK